MTGGAWPVLPLEPLVRLRIVRAMPPLSAALEAAVERHWAAACAARPLFNGLVFCADRIAPDEIAGHWTEYRRATAQMREPALFEALQVRSLAVCGVILSPDGVVVGRREAASAYQAGLWQLPPAGSVDHGAAEPGGASWRAAILAELREEVGLHPDDVTALRPLCLVQHPTGVLDMGVRIDTALDAATILARHRLAPDREYDRLMVVPPAGLARHVAQAGGTLVPSAAPFLARALAAQASDRSMDSDFSMNTESGSGAYQP